MWYEGVASPSSVKPLFWDVTYRDGYIALDFHHLVHFPIRECKEDIVSLPHGDVTCAALELSTETVVWEPWMDEITVTQPVLSLSEELATSIQPFPYTPIVRDGLSVETKYIDDDDLTPLSIPPFPYTPIARSETVQLSLPYVNLLSGGVSSLQSAAETLAISHRDFRNGLPRYAVCWSIW